MFLRRFQNVVLVVAAALAACTGCSSRRVAGVPLPPLSAVVVTPPTDTLVVGDSRQFVAAAFDTNGVVVAGAGFDWSADDPGVATVSSSGLVTAVGEGVTLVIAAAGGRSDTAVVAVIVR